MLHHQQLNNYQEGITSTTGLFQETEPELLKREEAANEFIVSSSDFQYYPLFPPQFLRPPDDPTKYDNHTICFTAQEFDHNVCSQYNNTNWQNHNYNHDDQFCLDNSSNIIPSCFLDGYVSNSTTTTGTAVPSFWPAYGCESVPAEGSSRKSNGGSLSERHRVATRVWRKKITEKTEELRKLVPAGGRKMHTAEMFEAAFKYVKYLQAQVGMLELMGSIQKNEDSLHQKDLQVLLASPIIQEKLYSEDKCLVPEGFVRNLANDGEIQSNHWIMKEINQLLQIDG